MENLSETLESLQIGDTETDKVKHLNSAASQVRRGFLRAPSLGWISKGTSFKWSSHFSLKENSITSLGKQADEEQTKSMWSSVSKTSRLHLWKLTKDLNFKNYSCETTTYIEFKALFFGIKSFKSLWSLSLSFSKEGMNITDQILDELGSCISRNFSGLRKLVIEFRNCPLVTSNGLGALASSIGRHLIDLKHLKLAFFRCPSIDDRSMKRIGMTICRNMLGLEIFEFNLASNQEITHEGVQVLSNEIASHLFRLRHIKFIFTGCRHIFDEGLEVVSLIGKRVKQLQSFELYFGDCNALTDKSLRALAVNLGQYYSQLKRLTLIFYWVHNATDSSIEELASQIGKNLTNLEMFSLTLPGTKDITDKSLEVIASDILGNLVKLQQLELYFYSTSKITNKSLIALSSMIAEKLFNMHTLILSFHNCELLTDEGLNFLMQKFADQDNNKWKTLKMKFNICPNLKEKDKLKKALEFIPSLTVE